MEAQKLLRQVRIVGRYGWLGGYTHAVMVDDGELIGPECVKSCYREISWATRHCEANGWQAVAVIALDDPDADATCAHCYKVLN